MNNRRIVYQYSDKSTHTVLCSDLLVIPCRYGFQDGIRATERLLSRQSFGALCHKNHQSQPAQTCSRRCAVGPRQPLQHPKNKYNTYAYLL